MKNTKKIYIGVGCFIFLGILGISWWLYQSHKKAIYVAPPTPTITKTAPIQKPETKNGVVAIPKNKK
jgi:hypothetical protein